MFFNATLSALPEHDNLSLNPVQQRYLALRKRVYWGMFLLAATLHLTAFCVSWLGGFEFYSLPPVWIFSWVITCLFLLFALYVTKSDPIKAYALREHDISFKTGLIFRRLVTQPIVRIQHVELKQGPLERRYNIAALVAFSAGGASHTFEIPGLDLVEAEQMRQYILSHREAASHV